MGRPKGSRNVKTLVKLSGLEHGGVKARALLAADAPQRYREAKEIIRRIYNAVEGLIWEGKGANCTLGEAQAIWQRAFDMEMKLLEHGAGKPTEMKEIKEERRLVVKIEGFDETKFRLPRPNEFRVAERVIEGEVREAVEVPLEGDSA